MFWFGRGSHQGKMQTYVPKGFLKKYSIFFISHFFLVLMTAGKLSATYYPFTSTVEEKDH